MTSISPIQALPSPLTGPPTYPASVIASPEDGVGPLVWFLAACNHCGLDLAQPFRDDVARDDWAARHLADRGHTVLISAESLADAVPAPAIAVRRETPGFQFLCMGTGRTCAKWNGPYDTPQLALASARAHVCVPAR